MTAGATEVSGAPATPRSGAGVGRGGRLTSTRAKLVTPEPKFHHEPLGSPDGFVRRSPFGPGSIVEDKLSDAMASANHAEINSFASAMEEVTNRRIRGDHTTVWVVPTGSESKTTQVFRQDRQPVAHAADPERCRQYWLTAGQSDHWLRLDGQRAERAKDHI